MARKFLINILVSALAVYAADSVLAGLVVYGGLASYVVAGFVLAALNTFLRPILKVLTFPLLLISLGLFTFILNAGILWIVSELVDRVYISGLWSLLWSTLIISAITTVLAPKGHNS